MSENTGKKKKIKSIRDVIIESIECEPGTEGCTGDPETCPNGPNQCDKKLSMFGYYDDTIKDSVENVYPSLFAFILLATYGFFLIYSLTNDVSSVAKEMRSISSNMHQVVIHMDTQTNTMKEMNAHVRNMGMSVNQMSHEVAVMNNSISRPMQFMNQFTPW